MGSISCNSLGLQKFLRLGADNRPSLEGNPSEEERRGKYLVPGCLAVGLWEWGPVGAVGTVGAGGAKAGKAPARLKPDEARSPLEP